MFSFRNINTVARYERKILSRSWFFRIFSALALIVIGIYSAELLFDKNPFTWDSRAISSNIVYSNLLMLSIAQSIIAIFLASDFLKRDKKLDTTEVLFIRPMTNTDYVIGKTMGIVSLFFFLNFLVLLITAVLTLASGSSIAFGAYLWYFLIISVPSLIFVLGLSFLLMSLLRNQAITFLLLLAYIGAVLFYLAKKHYFIFDFLSFKQPLILSDITGFSQLKGIILQRSIYLLSGLGFISLSVFLLKRLPQQKYTRLFSATLAVIFVLLSTLSAYNYYAHYKGLDTKHSEWALLSNQYFHQATASVKECMLDIEQSDVLKATAQLKLVNNTNKLLEKLVFSLNPDLKVNKVAINGSTTTFKRDQFVLLINTSNSIAIGDSILLTISYEGNIDNTVCYLDAVLEKKNQVHSTMLINSNPEFGFYSSKYALLTIENLWYPISGVRYDATKASVFNQEFTKFELNVKTQPGLLALSQGKREKIGENQYHFSNKMPLSQISLAIGNYEQKQIVIDSLELNILHFKGHDYFSDFFTEIDDTLEIVVKDIIAGFERPMAMSYPFKRFSIVEVPVQFKSLEHSWTSAMANSQPEMVFFTEGGFGLRQSDFEGSKKREQRHNKHEQKDVSEKEMQSNLIRGFAQEILFNENGQLNWGRIDEGISLNPLNVFPNYYNYVNYINSDACPVLNYAFESYVRSGEEDPRQNFFSRISGLSDDDKANILLNGKSLKSIIATESDKTSVNKVLKAKGEYLLTWIQEKASNEDLGGFLKSYLAKNRYKTIKHSDFAQEIKNKFNINLDDFIDNWYNSTEIPAYLSEDLKYYKAIKDDQQVFLAQTRITNYGNVGGIVKYTAMLGGGGSPGFGGGGMETAEYAYFIDAGETHEIQMVFDEQPRMVFLNMLIAKNIPSTSTYRRGRDSKAKMEKDMEAVAYNRITDDKVTLSIEGEYVVDNTDVGFSVYDPEAKNPIKKIFKQEDEPEFVGMGFGDAPATWKKTVNSDFYGEFEKSAYMVRAGEGNKIATWSTILPAKGYYDVYAAEDLIINQKMKHHTFIKYLAMTE